MQIHDVNHGFILKRVRDFPELEGRLWELEHRKTGAQLCWLDRADENKTFCIGFKTLPEDDTGVFHILEHSVLCGSDKYPVKEPFVELLKTSLQTFLNAMTAPDKTIYPFSTRNDRDFLNLMDIYLDAVLHPAIHHKPEIFLQEGWRLEDAGDHLCLQGVVFNEMKGDFASPQTVLEKVLWTELFPDTCYRWCYGGDPASIPELTYEQFLANHRKYYHPSNARVSLVGSLDLDACLEKLDSFFRSYERREVTFDIPMQAPLAERRVTVPYVVGGEEDPAHRTIVARASLLTTYDDDLRNDAFNVLSDYLAGDDEAPLKRAVLDADLAQDFSVGLTDDTQQSVASWTAWNTDPDKQPALEQTVRETLTRIVEEGLDRERLDACFRRYAFSLRDRDSGWGPRSLLEAMDLLDDWLYGGDPAQGLLVEEALTALEAALATDFPERLLREVLLDNPHTVTVTLIPSRTLGDELAEAEAQRIRDMTAPWQDADWYQREAEAEALRRWQQTPDSDEALATIPVLRREDLAPAPQPLRMTETALEGVPVLRHRVGGGLAYLRLHLDASDLRPEELPVLSVLCQLLGCMGTERFDRSRLPLELKRTLGRLRVNPTVVASNDPDRCRVLLSAAAACLPGQAQRAADLLAELLTATRWDDLALLRDNLQKLNLSAQMALASDGVRFAYCRAASGLTAHGVAMEHTTGVTYAQWLKTMSEAEDGALEALLGRMAALLRRLAVRERLTLSASENVPEAALAALLAAVPAGGSPVPGEAAYPLPGARREGVVIPAAVGFAYMYSTLRRHDLAYTGHIPVLINVLNFTYLWSEVRVQGGAYGCGFGCKAGGDLFCYTYRDPQPARSLKVMRAMADHVRAFCADDPDLTGFILGAVSDLDPLRGEEGKVAAAEGRWLRGVTEEDVRRWYDELIHTDPADLLALLPILEALAADNNLCVAAGKSLLEGCAELDALITV